jgi:uncharacterized membrane protein HdeD (DUF308 family)
LKLLKPTISYSEHFRSLVQTTIDARLNKQSAAYRSPAIRQALGTAMVFLFPKGVLIRTTQIIGSFVIVNGTISLFDAFKVKEQLATYAPTPVLPASKH